MLRNLIVLVAIAAIAYPAGFWFPWWVIAPVAATVCFLAGSRVLRAFGIAFLAGLLLWGGESLYLDQANQGILSSQIGALFQGLPGHMMPALSALIGGLTAGLGGLSGAACRNWLQPGG